MDKTLICEFCNEAIEDNKFYIVYCYAIDTDIRPARIGLTRLLDGLADYLMNKNLHLSATQIVLFRPDIMKIYLETIIKDEKIMSFGFEPYIICYGCYEEYDKQVPLL